MFARDAVFALIPIVAILGGFAFTISVFYFVVQWRRQKLEMQTQVQNKLIERFGSSADLIDFLQSPAGYAFMNGIQQAPLKYTREQIISGFRRSTVLTMLGAALTLLALYDRDFLPFGIIVLFLGAGYLGATFISMRLSRHMALPERQANGTPPPDEPGSTGLTTTTSEL